MSVPLLWLSVVRFGSIYGAGGLFYLVFIALAYQFNSWIVLPLLYYCDLGTVATPGVFWKEIFYGVIIALGFQLYSWWR